MGRITLKKSALAGTLSETVGYKSGLALDTKQIADHLGDEADLIHGAPDDLVTVRSEEMDDIVAALLYKVGNTPTPRVVFPVIDFTRPYRNDASKLEKAYRVVQIFIDVSDADLGGPDPLDITPALVRCADEMGSEGADLFLEFAALLQLKIHQAPFSRVRSVSWTDTAALRELFESESLATPYGSFLDQRFIDYLAQNFDAIDQMNWRKFEGLTCEFFERNGYHVEIAEGRNDGGIDARIWRVEPLASEPPAILVQCKRQRKKVEKVIVKALWADVVEEGAGSGLIVTTSALAPGADQVRVARSYPVEQADRETLRRWIEAMRTPFAGVFMGM